MCGMTVELARAPHAVARALAATVLIMVGATAAHSWAGGHLPGFPALVGLAGVVLGAGLLVLRGALGWQVLLPVVLVAQTGLHGMFGLLGVSSAEHASHASGAAMTGADPSQWSWQMLVAHTISTLLTAAVWWLCQRAAYAVVAALDTWSAYLTGRRDRRLPGRTRAVPSALVHLVGVPRRGPPAAPRCA